MPVTTMAAPCTVHRLGLIDYLKAWELQQRLAAACREDGLARLLLLEHPPTYTLGVRGRPEHLLLAQEALARLGAAVHRVDRGGDITYHGPGQLVAYPIIDLGRWNQGPRWYVRSLEAVLIETLAAFGIEAQRVEGRPGVWVGPAKIAAIGVRVSRGITSHGFALNVDPDLRFFSYIVPCGLADAAVTSMAEVLRHRTTNGAAGSGEHMPPPSGGGGEPSPQSGDAPSMDAVIDAVVNAFGRVFGLEVHDEWRGGAAFGPSSGRGLPLPAAGRRSGRPDGRPYCPVIVR